MLRLALTSVVGGLERLKVKDEFAGTPSAFTKVTFAGGSGIGIAAVALPPASGVNCKTLSPVAGSSIMVTGP